MNTLAPIKAGGRALAIVPQTYDELQRMANVFVKSGTFKSTSKNADAEQVMAECCIVIQRGLDVGLSPSQSVEGIAIINGKTLIYGDTLTALLWAGGCKVEKWCTGDGDNRAGHARITRPDGAVIEKTYSVDQAKSARLWDTRETVQRWGKNNSKYEANNDAPWHRFPERMLEWRAFGFAVKDGASDFSKGLAIVEEMSPQANAIASDDPVIDHQEATYIEAEPMPQREGGEFSRKGKRPSSNAYLQLQGNEKFNALRGDVGKINDSDELQSCFDAFERDGLAWAEFPVSWAELLHDDYCHRLADLREDEPEVAIADQIENKLMKATSLDKLRAVAMQHHGQEPWDDAPEDQRDDLQALFDERQAELQSVEAAE